jgi:two-component sensor histidine kinase
MPYCDEQERIRGAVLTFIDITARKRDEERLAGMVSELNHRVKNNLASVLSIVRQTKKRTRSKEEFGDAVSGQLYAMSTAHTILSRGEWQRADLGELARSVLAPFADAQSTRLELTGPAIELTPKAVVSLGLVLHELATNSSKYGAWSSGEGRVSLRWEYVQRDGGMLRVEWREAGGPPAHPPERHGFGMEFVRRTAEHELSGGCRTDFKPEGLVCTFELPQGALLGSARSPATDPATNR